MKYTQELEKNSRSYGSIPFWSWNDKLDPERLKAQIRDMHRLGMNGFFMHARSGLETEYLSDEWYDAIKVCVEEAKKYGMEPWSYDENGWPSGFAGGKLLDDPYNHAKFLKAEVKNTFDPEALAVYAIENGRSRRIDGEEPGLKEYFTVYKKSDTSYVDTLNDVVTRKFIKETHEDYKNKLGEDMWKDMPGFFTDEPQYFRYATVWSDTLPELFEKEYGYDIYSALDAMFTDFEGAKEFRYDYWRLAHNLFIDNFVKVIYDWCNENGSRLTGHAVEEVTLAGQMWCCGGIMPFYEYEHIPGIDHLGRNYDGGVASKQLGSAAAQLGKPKALSEMFGCCGWDVSPLELKRIAESQYVAGINIMCQHLYPYSERGQRKRDYPAHYSQHLPWQDQMKHFDEYFNRLGYTLSRGKEIAPVLVIHPVHSAWLNYKRDIDAPTIAELDESLRNVTAELYDRHIGFHYGDEDLMRKHGRVEGKTIVIGAQSYSAVVLPKIYTLDSSTVGLLKEYMANGGRMILTDGAPDRIDGRVNTSALSFLASNATLDELSDESELRVSTRLHDVRAMLRSTDRGRLAFVVNLTGETLNDLRIGLKGAKHLNILDINKGVFRKAVTDLCEKCGALRTTLDLEPGESVVVTEFEGEDELSPETRSETITAAGPFRSTAKPGNMMPLDHCRVSYNGTDFEESRPIELVRDILYRTRYAGKLWLKFEFDVKELPEELDLAIEPMNVLGVSVNGTDVPVVNGGWFDPSFLTASVTPLIRTGANDVTVSVNYFQRDYVYYVLYGGVSESLRNCLLFDTEIETIYLYGKFGVDTGSGNFEQGPRNSVIYTGPLYITKEPESIGMDDVPGSGYPFFAGSIPFEGRLDYKQGDPTELSLSGRFSVAEITVNGDYIDTLLFKKHIDLAKYLKPGKNVIGIKLFNSNRNLMGPHHGTDPEPYALGPIQFSYENQWTADGQCGWYHERYALVNFGAKLG
ncbi:MAG: hypothetical protein J5950_09030 [Clostridia bacterium]|nr:hypothetical protein [Clostridia bacterium]